MTEQIKKNRMTNSQKHYLINYLADNAEMREHDLSSLEGKKEWKLKWQEVAEHLNSMAGGTNKCPEKWQRAWTDLKANVKKKLIELAKHGGTGGGSALPPLTEIEEKVANMLPIEVVGVIEGRAQEAGISSCQGENSLNSETIIVEPPWTPLCGFYRTQEPDTPSPLKRRISNQSTEENPTKRLKREDEAVEFPEDPLALKPTTSQDEFFNNLVQVQKELLRSNEKLVEEVTSLKTVLTDMASSLRQIADTIEPSFR